jgi:hypothetical protein
LKTTNPTIPSTCTCSLTGPSNVTSYNDIGGALGGFSYTPIGNAVAHITIENRDYSIPRLLIDTPINNTLFSGLPSAVISNGLVYLIKDALTAGSCAAGGGSGTPTLCWSNGSTWIALSGGGGGSLISACSATPPTAGAANLICYDTAGSLQKCNNGASACTTSGQWVAQSIPVPIATAATPSTITERDASGNVIATNTLPAGLTDATPRLTAAGTLSATPTFTVLANSNPMVWTATLSVSNVTSSTLTATAATVGQILQLDLTQYSGGAVTFAWPSNWLNPCTVSQTANIVTHAFAWWNGSNAIGYLCSSGDTPLTGIPYFNGAGLPTVATAANLPVLHGQCTEAWGGSGTSFALTSGDDAIVNNTCYNDSGATRTITAIKCRSNYASNAVTLAPTFGSAGTGTTILAGAVTCGSSYAYSSMSTGCTGSTCTVSNASWTTGTGVDPAMGGTLAGSTSIALLVEYTYQPY